MMSLSKEWSILSKAMYGQEFVDELSAFLKEHNVKRILECGCGDGNVLNGLANKGFHGMGVDASSEMIALALENNCHQNISYRRMSWLDIKSLEEQFDAVMCRGNSLSVVASWDKKYINPKQTKENIKESINLFFQKLKSGGLLYLDTVPQDEVEGEREIKTGGVNLKCTVERDWKNRIRKTHGEGIIFGEYFEGGASSYLMSPDELEEMVRRFNPSTIWKPKLEKEINYEIICAIK